MQGLKYVGVLSAVAWALLLPANARDTATVGQNAIGTMAVAPSDTAPTADAETAIKRYVRTKLAAYTEYNTVTCKPVSDGAWTLDNPKPKWGKTSYGTITGKLGNGDCPSHIYTFAAIYYTWETHSDEAIKDAIDATYKTPDGQFNYEFNFSVKVPVVYPSSETSDAAGWDGDGLGLWRQTLHSASDPKFDWSLNTVQEHDPGGDGPDTCWCKGSSIAVFDKITGGTWYPNEKGEWEYDHVGWFTTSAEYYRRKRRAPCRTTFQQQMQFQATNVEKAWVDYGSVNVLGGSFDDSTMTSNRAGQSQSITRDPVKPARRLACSKIAWPSEPAILTSAGASRAQVDDPRPVAAAIEEIEKVSGVPITYEDPPFLNQGDLTAMVNGAGNDPAALMPKGGVLTFDLPANASVGAEIAAVENMVKSYNARRGAATFEVSQDDRFIHVMPKEAGGPARRLAPVTPVLDTRITLPAKPRSGAALLDEIVKAVSAASRQPVEIGMAPANALFSQQIAIGANNEAARDVLEKVIVANDLTLSWRLLYDPGLETYYLNLVIVPPPAGKS